MDRVIDFSRSFLWWRVDTLKKPAEAQTNKPPFTLNNARVPLDCLCHITAKDTKVTQTFALGASCKTEHVGVDQDIWMIPNADFVPIMSATHFLGVKTYQQVGMALPLYPPSRGLQPERQLVEIATAFDSARVDVAHSQGQVLKDPADVVQAILNNKNLVGRTAFSTQRYQVQLEYPFKTVNANERDQIFQPDTGPLLFPNLDLPPEDLLAGMELAYVAFNQPDWAEFLLRMPTPVAEGVQAYHYARSVRLECVNEVAELETN